MKQQHHYTNISTCKKTKGATTGFSTIIFLILNLLTTSITQVACSNANINAYKVLGLSSNKAPQKEIRQKYRELCLQYHPDKNVHHSPKEQEKCENTFKQIQTAYSEIGNEESRRGYDLKQRINQSPFTSSSNNNMNTNSFNADDILRTFFEEQSRYQQRRKPAIYFNGIDISNLFSTSSNTFPFGTNNMRNPFTSDETPSSPTTQPQQQSVPKSIYEQEITIPLQDLYNGIDIYKFKINDTILQRYKAAFRGGIINWIATKGLFTFFIPLWFKSNNLPLCLFLFVGFIHTNLPRPNVLDYETSIQRGWKSGTKLKFLGHSCKSDSTTSTFNNNAGNCDVVFILKEEVHDTFVRKGNDLYTNVAISKSMARKGCKVVINALGKLEDPIKVLIPRGNMRDSLEKVFVVKGRGWPKKRSKEKGDLYIHIKVIPDSQYYKDKKKKRVKKKKS